jgi:hypothetical protein
MNACSFTIYFKTISACFDVFVQCIMFFGEFEEASSSLSFQSAPLDRKAPPNTKKVKRTCIERFYHVDTLGSRSKP